MTDGPDETDPEGSAADEDGTTVTFMKSHNARSVIDQLLNPEKKKTDLEDWPIEARVLSGFLELSNSLRQNIDSYRVNIHGKGHRFEPVIRLDGPNAKKKVADALFVKALREARDVDVEKDLTTVAEPSVAEVDKKIAELKRSMALELSELNTFFDHAYPEGDFVDLRMISALDLESTGNMFWEVLRTEEGEPITLHWVRAHTIRIGPQEKNDVGVKQRRRISAIDFEQIPIRRMFHKFAQVDSSGKATRWFKQFGDPRTMSSKTGRYHTNLEAMIKEENDGDAEKATEIFHYKLPSLLSVYGSPRWIGNTPAVLGSRELDEVNLDLFVSNAVPALAILVSGGHVSGATYERLKEFFEEEVRGKKSMHKAIVIEAETQKKAGQQATVSPKIEITPLRSAQLKDSLFQGYDDSNRKKIRGDFRLPASVIGETPFNLQDLRFADEQVFDPERDSFDSVMNREILTSLGVRYWKFVSVGSILRNSDAVAELLLNATKAGIIVPDEGRELLGKLLNVDVDRVHTKWAGIPLPLLLALVGMRAGPAEAVREQGRQAGKESSPLDLLSGLGFGDDEDDDEREEVVASLLQPLKSTTDSTADE